jgi:hypothetical protein
MIRLSLTLLLSACLVALVGTAAAQEPAETPAVANPHGAPDQCTACHAPGETDDAPGEALSSIETCTACHVETAKDMHAVGLPPEKSTIPEGWPLEDGVVACATCHAEPACDATRPKEAPWHRGGPYPDELQMCWQCHSEEGMDREDPHHPATVRETADPTCSACHLGMPSKGAAATDSMLIQDPDKLCDFCHEGLQHSGMASHMGAEMGDLKGAQPGLFPLDEGGKIACWTCHEVHRDGDTVQAERLADGALRDALRTRLLEKDWTGLLPADVRWPEAKTERAEHTPMLVLPLADGQLCIGCHGDGP